MTNSAIEPPSITTHPASSVVTHGSAASFSIAATGAPILTYQWYAGPVGSTSLPIAGATSASYNFTPLTANKEVWVRISNAAAYADSRTATAVIGTASSAYQAWATN